MEGTIFEGHSEGRAESGSVGSTLGSTWSEDRKDARTESANWWRNSLALEKGRIKRSE